MYSKPRFQFSKDARLYFKVFCIAFVVAFLFFLPFLIKDEGIFLFYGDYNVQQIPFYQLAHRAIHEGNWGFNFYTDLGSNFIGSYSFYLIGSPFFWLTLPFPNEALPYLMAPLFFLKFATAAVTACAFIRRFVNNRNFALIGGLLYAFSGFAVYNIFFNHFHEVIAFFPLLLLGLEQYMTENRRGVFALAIALCATVNYFFFAGQVTFVVLYFFIRLISSNDWQIDLKKFFWLGFESVVGLALSMFLLLPSILAIMGNPRVDSSLNSWSFLMYYKEQRYFAIFETFFFPPDIPARPNFFPDADAKWASLGGWLPLLGMTGVIAFMKANKGHFAKRLVITSLIMAMVPGLNSAFFAFNSAYYARWFYMPILILAMMSVVALEKSEEIDYNSGIKWTLGITLAFCVVGVMPKVEDGKMSYGLTPFPARFWGYVAITLSSILITAILINYLRKSKYFTTITALAVCGITIIYSIMFIGTGKSHSYEEKFIINNAIRGKQNITLPRDEFYRIDVYDGMDNLPMFWEFPTIQTFHSIVPSSIMEYYTSTGGERDVGSRPEPKFYGLRTLTSVKYLFIESNKQSPEVCVGFEKFDSQNGFDIYLNQNYVPMGFTYDYYVDKEVFDYTTAESRDRLMLKGIYLNQEQISKYGDLLERLELYPDLSEYTLEEDTAILRKECASSFKIHNKGFTSTISLSQDNLVFFSVPYDEGFKATVNGAPAEIEKVNVGFMAVKVPKGENNVIEFTYTTPGLALGAKVSLGTALVLIIYMGGFYLADKKKKRVVGGQENCAQTGQDIPEQLSFEDLNVWGMIENTTQNNSPYDPSVIAQEDSLTEPDDTETFVPEPRQDIDLDSDGNQQEPQEI